MAFLSVLFLLDTYPHHPNRKALDRLTASEIKKAAGPMCKTLPRESLSPKIIKKVFGQDKKGTRAL